MPAGRAATGDVTIERASVARSPLSHHIGDRGVAATTPSTGRDKPSESEPPMIVSRVPDRLLRQAVRNAAHPEEEVVSDPDLVLEALQLGFPAAASCARGSSLHAGPTYDVRDLGSGRCSPESAGRSRGAHGSFPAPRLEHLTGRLRHPRGALGYGRHVGRHHLGRAQPCGRSCRFPRPLRAFARHVLEFPSRYKTLARPLADCCDLTRGALKATIPPSWPCRRPTPTCGGSGSWPWRRFSPTVRVTVAQGSASPGLHLGGQPVPCDRPARRHDRRPSLRTVHGWRRLVVRFAWIHLTPDALEAWSTLEELFRRQGRLDEEIALACRCRSVGLLLGGTCLGS